MLFAPKSSRVVALLLVASLALTACKTAEEQAQDHFESGMELLEQGDTARAFVEFRNVFRLNPAHKEARLAYARTQKERGVMNDAYAQYLRLVEQYPDTLEARIELAEIAFANRNLQEAERHGRAAQKLEADNPRVKVIVTALNYAEAIRENDSAAASDQAAIARDLVVENPDRILARQIVIDNYLRTDEMDAALAAVNAGLEVDPNNDGLYGTKLQILSKNDDQEGIGETLKHMVEQFPDNEEARRLLIAWYMKRKDLDNAELYLRQLADRPDSGQEDKLTVVRFLLQARGPDEARAELRALIEAEGENFSYRALLASMEFDAGERDKAIADLEELVKQEGPAEEKNKAKVILVQMLMQTGNTLGARALVEEILVDDQTNVAALKMRASWLIDEDKPDDAVIDLRTALAQDPQDADIVTLMASAHDRAGSRDLAGERYAKAVEVSEQAPQESLRYSSFLIQEDRIDAAKAVLTEALEKAPNNVDLMRNLALLHQRTEDWNEVTRIIWRLRALETDVATASANGLEAEMLLRQERLDDTITFLEGVANEGGASSTAAIAALVRTKVQAGKIDEAVEQIEQNLKENPDDSMLRFLRAGMHMLQNERDEAAEIYRDLLEQAPGHERIMRTLHAILMAGGQEDEAAALIEEQIAKASNPTAALLMKAERLERDKDFEGAIGVYESLYEMNSGNIVVANNLASMITTHRDTPEDLDRAFAIARRLKSSGIPAMQDTYGWIEYRRGNYEEALKYLEPAAKGMSEHALVQFHLGMNYHALKRSADAQKTLEKALELAGDDPLPQFRKAREILEELKFQ